MDDPENLSMEEKTRRYEELNKKGKGESSSPREMYLQSEKNKKSSNRLALVFVIVFVILFLLYFVGSLSDKKNSSTGSGSSSSSSQKFLAYNYAEDFVKTAQVPLHRGIPGYI